MVAEQRIAYYGVPEPQAVAKTMRAGPWTLAYHHADLRYIRYGDQEVVRRVYFAVRDTQWGTAPNRIDSQVIESGGGAFMIRLTGSSEQGDVGLAWQMVILGTREGKITFQVRGRATRAFSYNRIGLCLLHPAACAGAPCRVTHSDGTVEEGRFPVRIAPHQPFMDIGAIAHQVQEGVWASVALEGEVFEMEDQRNWTDASYKTYSTPLALPIPQEMRQGQAIEQRLTLQLEGEIDQEPLVERKAEPLVLGLSEPDSKALPPIGLGAACRAYSLDGPQAAALRALGLDHLCVEVGAATTQTMLDWYAHEARALGAALELVLLDAAPATMERALEWAQCLHLSIARLLLCAAPGDDVCSMVACARRALSDVRLGVGTDGYFTHLNRERPDACGAELAFYSLNPQVHASDNLSLIETLPTQAETVISAQALYPDHPVCVSPITLKPRLPQGLRCSGSAPDDGLPGDVDPRQMSLLGAGWTLGSLASLAGAGVESLTLYQTVGMRGVMAGDADLDGPFYAQTGDRYPVYYLLRWLAGWRGATVLSVEGLDPLRITALALRRGHRRRVMLANLSGESLEVALRWPHGRAEATWLDERNVAAARLGAQGETIELAAHDGRISLRLLPYGLVCIDGEAGL